MNALITGGAGFIGSHLAEVLLRRGDRVVVIDDLSTGSLDNILPLTTHSHFHYHVDSVTNRTLLSTLVDECDVVFHLAAAVGVRLVVNSPARAIMTNIAGTEVVLQAAAKRRRTVLLTSSSEVYGKRTDASFREDDDLLLGPPTQRRWSYACSKAVDEFLALAYWEEHHVPVVITRLFNTVGPRQSGHYGMVLPRFVEAALAGAPITVYGDGQQSRCFAHIAEVAPILAALADHPAAVGAIVNVGSDVETTIAALARQVKAHTQSASPIVFVPYDVAYGRDVDDMRRRVPDLGKLERLVGGRPTMDLSEILTSVIAHSRRELNAAAGRAAR